MTSQGMIHEAMCNGVRIAVTQGDITLQDTDAIVNAANSALRPGAGVDGAIQRAAGSELLREREVARRRLGGMLPTGEAVSTGPGQLQIKRIIHTAGPVWDGGGSGEREALTSSYRECLRVAKAEGLKSIAFPSVSTGIYGYPVEAAAQVAVEAVGAELEADPGSLREVRFVLFDERTLGVFLAALNDICGET